ncbi:hypothetical protein GGR54DRAFT_129033 [Hypoxylon sp. NC1633]|nr:hypothetical protein GGR54DRAFT_129033 [Hypoxylon sp. NC1633]
MSVRGTKRKYAEDGPEMGESAAFGSPADLRVLWPVAAASNTDLSPQPVALRGDDYYKALYTEGLDFRLLAERDPEFKPVLESNSHLDFANPKSVMQLTKTLLKLDFGLLADLPMDRLCPPVPNRHNYILWLKDLLDSSAPSPPDSGDTTRRIVGLDIGTGASVIYPLLGCAQRPSWSFVATDVDEKSLAFARKNVRLNNLQARIRVVDRSVTDCLVPLDELCLEAIDFVMVNPPFYASKAELEDLTEQKDRPPNSTCTGAPVEMVCAGGEIGFVRRIVHESLVLKKRVQWYTSMLGKQSSLKVLIGILKGHDVSNYAVTAFVQGNKTRRWAVGWSFGDRRPSLSASRGCEPSGGKKLLPPPTETTLATWSVLQADPEKLKRLERNICDTMGNLDLVSWTWDKALARGVGRADGNVWSRAYRRRRAWERRQLGSDETAQEGPSSPRGKGPGRKADQDPGQYIFGFSVALQVWRDEGVEEEKVAVVARWLQGNDYTNFESFVGFLLKSIRLT